MHWSDTGIVISVRQHGESSAIVRLLTEQHGLHAGLVRGAFSKRSRGTFQAGNLVSANWSARLSEHLGTFQCELIENNAVHFVQDATRLAVLNSACALLEMTLPERHDEPALYQALLTLLCDHSVPRETFLQQYARLEFLLLSELGFGLDFSECALTGTTEDLAYVSPKTGRACSRAAGRQYKHKLLVLPGFLLAEKPDDVARPDEINEALSLTGYFLEKWVLGPHGKSLPQSRKRLLEKITEPA